MRCTRHGTGSNPVRPNRSRNILERLLSQILEDEIEFADSVFLNARRHGDAARLC
jgi:hypothetical protein